MKYSFLKRLDEETLDKFLAEEAAKNGWADNRLKHAARVLRILNSRGEVHDKEMREKIRDVIAFLEAYKLD